MININKLNDKIGDKLAFWLSTMWMFYVITFLVVIPLFFQTPTGLVQWMQYVVSVFFQGVALPVLGYVAKKAGDQNEKVMTETHDAVMRELEIVKTIFKNQHRESKKERKEIKEILERLESLKKL